MSDDAVRESIKRQIEREHMQRSEENQARAHEDQRIARGQWDSLRQSVRQRYFDAWLDDVAHRLKRPRDMVRLRNIAETYTLQDAINDALYRWRIGQLPGFEREVPVEQANEFIRLVDKLTTRLPDTSVYLHCGTSALWLRDSEPEDWMVWGNGSGYFGAVEATSADVLANMPAWLKRENDVPITMVSSVEASDSLSAFIVNDQRGTSYTDSR